MSSTKATAQPMVKIRGVSKHYGATRVLEGVDLDIEGGEIVMLTGPSGAGKSTLLHLLAALDAPDQGEISVAGRLVRRHHNRNLSGFRRDHVGIIFQLHNLIPRLTARQNVEIAMFGSHRSRRERAERAGELLETVGLAHRSESRPPTMSGGERQRVAVARGLANDPPVLLADEPTGSLDDASTALITKTLRSMADAGVAVLAVSHDPRLIVEADRLLRLEDGQVSELLRGTAPKV